MDYVTVSLVLGGIACTVGVLGWLDFKPSGPRIVGGIWACVQAPRKRLAALEKQVAWLTEAESHTVDYIGADVQAADSMRDELAQLKQRVDALADQLAEMDKNVDSTFEIALGDTSDLHYRVKRLENELAEQIGPPPPLEVLRNGPRT